jgi:methyltransferase (TIGR00027 family)
MERKRLSRTSSNTAEINAVQRAAETRKPPGRRLIDDPYARHFVQAPHYRAVAASAVVGRGALRFIERRYPGLNAIILMRARYATEAVAEAAASGTGQCVLLGAGYDSTALRHRGPPMRFFELDAPTTQAAKLECIERHGLESPSVVTHVPCDFERDSPGALLEAAGFDLARPCLVIWLGVSYYLTREAFERTQGEVAGFTASGSTLVLDYMDPEVAAGTSGHPGAQRLHATVARRGEPYVSGFEAAELEELLDRTGFAVRDHPRLPELSRRYGAWCREAPYAGVVKAERRA